MNLRSRSRLLLAVSLVLPLVVAGAVAVAQARKGAAVPAVVEAESKDYFCPMHPLVISDREGSCPICGMHLVKRSGKQQPGAHDHDAHDHDAHDHGMHEQDAPAHDAHEHGAPPAASPAPQVFVPAETQQRMGLTVETVQPAPFSPSLVVAAQAIADARHAVSHSPKVDGWIRRLGVAVVGQPVRRGQMLYEIYSPDLQQRQKDYIDLLSRRDSLLAVKGTDMAGLANSTPDLMLASVARERFRLRARLLAADVPEAVIGELEQFRRVRDVVPVLADRDGVVTAIGATEGAYITPQTIVVGYADPRVAWAELSMNPEIVAQLGQGAQVELRSPIDGTALPPVKLDASLAVVDPQSRTARIRVPLPSAGRSLLAGTLLEARLRLPSRTALVVHSDAVIRTGHGDFIMLADAGNHFHQAAVQLGAENGDRVEVLAGLVAGDQVITNGQFLLSAEAELHAAMRRMTAAPVAAANAHAGHGT